MSNEKIKKVYGIFSIIIFLMIIVAPLVFINKNADKISIVENKKLASFPRIYNSDGKLNYTFLTEFESFIDDNIGFKEDVVIGDIALNYKIFKKLKVPNFIIGKEENLFYTSGGADIITIQGKNLFSDSKLEELSQGFTYMKEYFESKGADFYIMTIPNKEEVYPEFYPDSIKNIVSKTRLDYLSEYILKSTDVNIFNVKQELINNKNGEMLYYKNYDCTHWNMNGAFVGYTEIIKQLSKKYSNLKCYEKEDFVIETLKSKGAISHLSEFNILNKAMAFDDEIFSYHLKKGYQAQQSAEMPEGVEIDVNDKYFHYTNTNIENEQSILIIGDSYIYSFILPLLAEHFSELYFVNYTSAQELMNLQNIVHADIVLYEFVDRAFNADISKNLNYFKDNRVEKTDIKELSIVEDTPVLNIDSPLAENGVLWIDANQMKQSIIGWAIDSKAEALASDVYMKVGESYYRVNFFERPDLTSIKQEYLMAGFSLDIPTNEIIKAGKVQFIIISNDGVYQYQPVEFIISSN
ncbi:hypothetical protein acsn021_09550 [Anaerocolumna cellulosilytica]|uniref:Uncharacterized protein n=1 Tax=Anaerocolumna cellulosilytica TaxID=433286 RepID=A0A6S6QUL8_9FIRM|nr:hypothetical protein [Anaerocolumna cellulosilytica]MBB5194441.1 hypothetical protein [Anaerocolumna cellulosilytica]BCJ93386.1 hypothetical protein acsn021_09550 [Anaerocolumna cellulosilytica]